MVRYAVMWTAAFAVVLAAESAFAADDDYGPLADVLAVRNVGDSLYGRATVERVIVAGRYASVEIGSKGYAAFLMVRKPDGTWHPLLGGGGADLDGAFSASGSGLSQRLQRAAASGVPRWALGVLVRRQNQRINAADEPGMTPAPIAVPASHRDAFGPAAGIDRACADLGAAAALYRPSEQHALRHLIIVGRHALTTLRIGADTFNIIAVQMKHGWSAPFVLGIGYPFRDALMERGVSPPDAERFYAALVALEAVPPAARKPACPD
ncbi:MAG: hypothetical protein GIW94_07720 [Candidatus Eremiobacteraeota bacterium]|nr:hypothetical protein [Candidatus Eremiobacteraeota bacterium]